MAMLVLTVVVSWLWGQMLQPVCNEIQRPDLSLQEMVDVKLKVDDSERQGSAPLRLSGREATFVLREVLRLPMHVEVHDGAMTLDAAMPYRDACYNIHYEGSAEVREGVATLAPSRFVIGELDVAPWTEGDTELAQLEWVSPTVAEMMTHVESLRIDGAEVVVDIDDVRMFR